MYCDRREGEVCFTRGVYGAPAAADTLEMIRALSIRRVVVGMCGGFSNDIEFTEPDRELFDRCRAYFTGRFEVMTDAAVSSDAFYRQIFAKEVLWREKGCVGVYMESSALLSVSKYY